jgi:hypothetical protein
MKLQLTKLEVAERQINEVVRLFFEDRDPVAIHTLISAVDGIVTALGRKKNIYNPIRDAELYIKPEWHKFWFQKMNDSANFFKHADKDHDETHEFNTELNDIHLMCAIMVFVKVTGKYNPATKVFFSWFALKYPNLIKDKTEAPLAGIYQSALKDGVSPENKSLFLQMLDSPALTLKSY